MRFADRADAGRRLARALADTATAIRSCWRCRAAACRSPPRSRRRSPRRSTSCWCARSAFRGNRNWRWARWSTATIRSSRATKRSSAPPGSTSARSRRRGSARSSELEDARRRLIGDRPRAAIAGRAAILVDDGVATGATARAALQSIRRRGAKTLTLAVPVASAEALAALKREADDLVCLEAPVRFGAVSAFYADFRQVEDEEAVAILARFSPAAR